MNKCQNCKNIKQGGVIFAVPVVKGMICNRCGRIVEELNWDEIPFHRKIIRWVKYYKNNKLIKNK